MADASAARIRALVADRFAALGVSEPEERAQDFLALVDGLLFDQLVGAGGRAFWGQATRSGYSHPRGRRSPATR